jgi:hypothetical protein
MEALGGYRSAARSGLISSSIAALQMGGPSLLATSNNSLQLKSYDVISIVIDCAPS